MRSTTLPDKTSIALRVIWTACAIAGSAALAGCGTDPADGSSLTTLFGEPAGRSSPPPDIVASVINVTPYEVSVVLSGILEDSVDTVRRTVPTLDSIDVGFACVDELVVGDPLDPAAAGVVVEVDDELEDEVVEIDPFALILDTAFACGDIVEIIVSGNDPENIAVDVFALTP